LLYTQLAYAYLFQFQFRRAHRAHCLDAEIFSGRPSIYELNIFSQIMKWLNG